ncbi:MAG TPA: tetratricopeptide repeat protein [Polyangia bacterium]|nr:tetratricopeptide repeat protein [Polyangia bacterium]
MRAAVRASPRSTAFVALAHALCEEGLCDEAETVCLQGLLHHPDLPTAQVALARAWLSAGKTTEAELRLAETIRQHPHHAEAYRYLAKVMAATGRRAEAVAMLTRTRSHIVWTHELAALLDALTEGLPFEPDGDEAEITRVTPPRDLEGERRTGERRQAGERRHARTRTFSSENTVRVERSRFDDADMREYAAAAPTPPPRPTRTPSRFIPRADSRATPVERKHTPTGSFPPIATEGLEPTPAPGRWSPRWLAILAIPSLVIVALGVWTFRGGRIPGRSRSASAPGEAASPAIVPDSSVFAAQVAADIEADLASGGLDRLLDARNRGAPHLGRMPSDDEARVDLEFVAGLLALDYGITTDAADAWRLTAGESPDARDGSARVAARAAAAKALLALAAGDQLAAAQAARAAAAAAPDDERVRLATIATRHRAGDLAGARTALAAVPRLAETWGAARPTVAALEIDGGRPDAALAALQPALRSGTDDALVLSLAREAQRARSARGAPDDAETPTLAGRLGAACARDQERSPTVRAACLLDQAVDRRLAGDRAGAVATAERAAAVDNQNPRLLGGLAQLLANLGEIDRAAAVVEVGTRLASAAFPALAWANVAIAIGRGGAAPVPAGIPASSSESRLVAARALEPAVAGAVSTTAAERDPDLRWLSALALGESGTRRQVIRFVGSLEKIGDPTPVTAYVAGTLAFKQGHRHLAARWLAQALTGHGDTCRAAQEYSAVLHMLKKTDRLDEIRAALAGHNSRCALDRAPP